MITSYICAQNFRCGFTNFTPDVHFVLIYCPLSFSENTDGRISLFVDLQSLRNII